MAIALPRDHYSLGTVRGRPKRASRLLPSNRVIAEICSARTVNTMIPLPAARCPMDVCVRVREVKAERGLVVGSGRYHLDVLTPDAPTVQVLGDDSQAPELERLGRHRELGVIAEQGDHCFEIGPAGMSR